MRKDDFIWVDKPEDPNIGLTDEEIDDLQKNLNLKFPEGYIRYLRKTGRKSNVFQVEYDIVKLKEYQTQLRKSFEMRDMLHDDDQLFCLQYEKYYHSLINTDLECFYFFNLSNGKPLDLYVFEDEVTNVNWSGYWKQLKNEGDFVSYINKMTEEKFEKSKKERLTFLQIIFLPFFIILIGIFILFEMIKEKILNK